MRRREQNAIPIGFMFLCATLPSSPFCLFHELAQISLQVHCDVTMQNVGSTRLKFCILIGFFLLNELILFNYFGV